MLRAAVAVVAAAVLSACTTIIYVDPPQVEEMDDKTTGDPENTTHPRTVEDEGGIVITTEVPEETETTTGEIETSTDDPETTGEIEDSTTGDDLAGPDELCQTDEDCAVGRCLASEHIPFGDSERRCGVACDLDAPADACALAGSAGLCGVYEDEGRCLGHLPDVTQHLDLDGSYAAAAISAGELHAIRVAGAPETQRLLVLDGDAAGQLYGPWGQHLAGLAPDEPQIVGGVTYWLLVEGVGEGSYEVVVVPQKKSLGAPCASDEECVSGICDGVCVL
jgi:hypothetical protein